MSEKRKTVMEYLGERLESIDSIQNPFQNPFYELTETQKITTQFFGEILNSLINRVEELEKQLSD